MDVQAQRANGGLGAGRQVEMVAAGVHWDAVKLQRDLGEGVLNQLLDACGAAIDDGYYLYLFVRPGQGDFLRADGVLVLAATAHIAVPPVSRTAAPGPHWRRTPGEAGLYTGSLLLRDAIVLSRELLSRG